MKKLFAAAVGFTIAAQLSGFPAQAASNGINALIGISQLKAGNANEDAGQAVENTNAENVRSQAEKRLEQQRKDLTRNWGG